VVRFQHSYPGVTIMKGVSPFPKSESLRVFLNHLLPALQKIPAIPEGESFAEAPFDGRWRSDPD